jgi:predicted N-acetyltransferase YhbS
MTTPTPPIASAAAFTSRLVVPADYAELQRLHDHVFGPGALTRTAYRVREGLPPQSPFCRVVVRNHGPMIAAIRFTPITIGGVGPALLLGPLAVDPAFANQGHGRRLIAEALEAARTAGIALVLLVGDAPYYAKLGFEPVPPQLISLPGPVDPRRLLVAHLDESRSRAMAGAVQGVV